jgi:N-methylhydantoinase A
LAPGVPLAGGLVLDRPAAVAAVTDVASALGISTEEAALGAIQVVNAAMERALRRISVEAGHDPADYVLVAFGGAGGLHACDLADALEMRAVFIPSSPGALSAIGLAVASPVATASRSVLGLPPTALEGVFHELEAHAAGQLPVTAVERRRRIVEARYKGQAWELALDWPEDGDLATAFAAGHERRFGYSRPGEPVEIVTLRTVVTAAGADALPNLTPRDEGAHGDVQVLTTHGWRPARHRPRHSLRPGDQAVGPHLLTQPDATVYVAPGWVGTATAWGDLELRPI